MKTVAAYNAWRTKLVGFSIIAPSAITEYVMHIRATAIETIPAGRMRDLALRDVAEIERLLRHRRVA